MNNDLMDRITALKKQTDYACGNMEYESDASDLGTLVLKMMDIMQDMIAQMPTAPTVQTATTASTVAMPNDPSPYEPDVIYDGEAEQAEYARFLEDEDDWDDDEQDDDDFIAGAMLVGESGYVEAMQMEYDDDDDYTELYSDNN